MRASHDELRVEIARMDATMQDAAEAADRERTQSAAAAGTGADRSDSSSDHKRSRRDAAEIGADFGGAVGDILRGKFWSGWGGPTNEREDRKGKVPGEIGGSGADAERSGRGNRRRGPRAGESRGDSDVGRDTEEVRARGKGGGLGLFGDGCRQGAMVLEARVEAGGGQA